MSVWRKPLSRPGHGEFEAVADYYDHLMRSVPYQEWIDYVEQIVRRWRVQPRDVLDLACGTGKIGSELLRRGYHAIGADMSDPMARHCARQNPPLPVVVCDASCLALATESFDLIVCLFDSLNYILELSLFEAAMAEAYRVLRRGGLFIFDLNTIHALATDLFTQSRREGPDPLHYEWRAHWDPQTRICRVDMWFGYYAPDGLHEFRETHYQRAYTHQEVKAALKKAGFRKQKAYEAYRFSPLTPWSDRAYYVALKE